MFSHGVFNDTSFGLLLWWSGASKNVINTMMMSVLPLAIASLLWVVAGYSLSFGGQGYFFGILVISFYMESLKRLQVVV